MFGPSFLSVGLLSFNFPAWCRPAVQLSALLTGGCGPPRISGRVQKAFCAGPAEPTVAACSVALFLTFSVLSGFLDAGAERHPSFVFSRFLISSVVCCSTRSHPLRPSTISSFYCLIFCLFLPLIYFLFYVTSLFPLHRVLFPLFPSNHFHVSLAPLHLLIFSSPCSPFLLLSSRLSTFHRS